MSIKNIYIFFKEFYYTHPIKYLYTKLNPVIGYDKNYKKLILTYKNYENLEGEKSNKIIFMCDGKINQGGLTDRFRGIISTYFLAKILNRSFYINWTSPFRLEKFLQPNKYNWHIENKEIKYNINTSLVIVLQTNKSKFKNFLNYLIFINYISKRRKEKHIYSNYFFPKFIYCRLFHHLFKPTSELSFEIEYHKKIIGENYWSFSFRFQQLLGDFKDPGGRILSKEASERLIHKNLNELSKLIHTLPENYKFLITSDSKRFLGKAAKIDSRIYIVPGSIPHIDFETGDISSYSKMFIEYYLIMSAKKVYLMITDDMYKSRFAEFAALLGNKKFIVHRF